VHALLGQLYEQLGDAVAARYHFQEALNNDSSPVCAELPSDPPVAPLPPPARSGWAIWMLIGLVLFSGLAVFVAYWPGEHRVERGAIFWTRIKRPQLPITPEWTWHQPLMARDVPVANAADPVQNSAPSEVTSVVEHKEVATIGTNNLAPPLPAPPASPAVLGPAARRGLPVSTGEATLDDADKAYFAGQYEQAVAIYENLLLHDEANNPRLHQDAAYCYQQLGNSEQAATHLDRAILGYQTLLTQDPQSAVAQHGLTTCTVARNLLRASQRPPD